MDIASHAISVTQHTKKRLQLQQANFGTLLKDVRDALQSTHDERAAAAKVVAEQRAAAKQAATEREERRKQEKRAALQPKLALLLEHLQKLAAQPGAP